MRSAQIISNGEKARSGKEVKAKVKSLLIALLEDNLILEFEEDVSHSHKQFPYKKQFKSDFVVKTIDNKFILIRASNSYRSDRVKIPFYDFMGVQQFSSFSGNIVASVLLFPDGEENNSTFLSTRQKVQQGKFFSPATHWLTFSELNEFFSNYCAEVEETIATDENVDVHFQAALPLTSYEKTFAATLSSVGEIDGSYYGRAGNSFERFLVQELNNPENLASFKNGASECFEFDTIMRFLVEDFSINREAIYTIVATDTITKLKNGGSPKTDIHLKIYSNPHEYEVVNISIKNTNSARVSCHDYQAKDFIRVLGPTDDELRIVIEMFQEAGSWKAYADLAKERNESVDTDNTLRRYMPRLIEWAIKGEHDIENILSNDTQVANYLLTRNSRSGLCKIQSAESYIQELNSLAEHGKSSPFSWTYPSKRRGERIQLKMPISLPQV